MLNNRITFLTCIQCKAGIKHGAGEKKRRIEKKSEAIKKRSVAYLFKKWRPRGDEGRKEMGMREWCGDKGRGEEAMGSWSSIRCI